MAFKSKNTKHKFMDFRSLTNEYYRKSINAEGAAKQTGWKRVYGQGRIPFLWTNGRWTNGRGDRS